MLVLFIELVVQVECQVIFCVECEVLYVEMIIQVVCDEDCEWEGMVGDGFG